MTRHRNGSGLNKCQQQIANQCKGQATVTDWLGVFDDVIVICGACGWKLFTLGALAILNTSVSLT